MIIEEGKIQFDFSDEHWDVVKYDELKDFEKIKDAVPFTKGVDIIGIKNNTAIVIFEIKDFRGNRIQNKPRVAQGDNPLDIEFAQKVTGTIAGIIGGARNSTHHKDYWEKCMDIFKNHDKQIDLVLWLEEDTPVKNISIKERRRRNTFLKNLKKRGAWLTGRVFLANRNSNPYSDSLSVNYI